MTSAPWWEQFFDEDSPSGGWATVSTDGDEEAAALWRILGLSASSRVLDARLRLRAGEPSLARLGARVLGVDQSAPLLAEAERRRGSVAPEQLRYVRHDLREPLAESGFDVALSLFSSLGYGDESDDAAILGTLARAVKPGGKVAVDTMHRDVLAARLAREAVPAHRLPDGTLLVVEEPRFDPVAGRVETSWFWAGPRGSGQKSASIRVYTITELVRLLERVGLRLEAALHPGTGAPFAPRARPSAAACSWSPSPRLRRESAAPGRVCVADVSRSGHHPLAGRAVKPGGCSRARERGEPFEASSLVDGSAGVRSRARARPDTASRVLAGRTGRHDRGADTLGTDAHPTTGGRALRGGGLPARGRGAEARGSGRPEHRRLGHRRGDAGRGRRAGRSRVRPGCARGDPGFRFTPAEIDGKPSPVRITYAYDFVLRPAPTAVQVQQEGPVNFSGEVLERGNRKPLAGAEVAPAVGMSTVTDARGRSRFATSLRATCRWSSPRASSSASRPASASTPGS